MEKTVLLFSGGLDSMLLEYMTNPDVLLYVDMKTSYSDVEILSLRTLPKSYKDRIKIVSLPLTEYERGNKYLPYRNLLLGTIAMQYGQHIYFGFNSTDCAPDKDKVFLRRLNYLFKHLNKNSIADMGWESKNFSFSAPLVKYTKSEAIKKCLRKGMDVELIRNIRTCYDSISVKGCGVCPVCLRKAVALLSNDISIEGLFDVPITKADILKEFNVIQENIRNGEYYPKNYLKEWEYACRTAK